MSINYSPVTSGFTSSNTDPKALNLYKMPKPMGLREIRDRLNGIRLGLSRGNYVTKFELKILIADLERQMGDT